MIGKGDNIVPTVHVKDVVRCVAKVCAVKPENHYILAVDGTCIKNGVSTGTQRELVKAISQGMGTGKIRDVDPQDVACEDWAKWMQLDIMLRPSDIMKLNEPVEGDEEKTVEFQWEAENGLAANIESVRTQFNAFRNLRPIKIFLSGPPGAGKTFFGERLAKHYNVELIKAKDVVSGFKKEEMDKYEEGGEDDPYGSMREEFKTMIEAKMDEMCANDKKLKREAIDPNTVEIKWPPKAMAMA